MGVYQDEVKRSDLQIDKNVFSWKQIKNNTKNGGSRFSVNIEDTVKLNKPLHFLMGAGCSGHFFSPNIY